MAPFFRRCLVLLAFVCCLTPLAAWSDAYPSKPIRLVIPFSSGGATDVVARIVAQKLTEALKQSVVVDSRPGANGIIGTDIVAKAAPDGYTLLASVASARDQFQSRVITVYYICGAARDNGQDNFPMAITQEAKWAHRTQISRNFRTLGD